MQSRTPKATLDLKSFHRFAAAALTSTQYNAARRACAQESVKRNRLASTRTDTLAIPCMAACLSAGTKWSLAGGVCIQWMMMDGGCPRGWMRGYALKLCAVRLAIRCGQADSHCNGARGSRILPASQAVDAVLESRQALPPPPLWHLPTASTTRTRAAVRTRIQRPSLPPSRLLQGPSILPSTTILQTTGTKLSDTQGRCPDIPSQPSLSRHISAHSADDEATACSFLSRQTPHWPLSPRSTSRSSKRSVLDGIHLLTTSTYYLLVYATRQRRGCLVSPASWQLSHPQLWPLGTRGPPRRRQRQRRQKGD